jgi:release factor glutamine methyltransferase
MKRDTAWLLEEKYASGDTQGFEDDLKRLSAGEPVAYVIGWQPFLGLKMHLGSRPLIPRTETEWWTEQLVEYAKEKFADRAITFLDLCAGSGAIGCGALARLPHAAVYFGDIDPAHEATILKNIRANGLDESRATVRSGYLFNPFDGVRFDIIASNPPYVPTDRALPESVANYEPALALLSGPDGMDLMRRIAKELPLRLADQGVAWIECDRGHAAASRALFEEQGFNAEIRTDQYGKPRIIVVSFS